jgi:hypothetical protein
MFDTVALLMIGLAPWLKTPRGDVHPVYRTHGARPIFKARGPAASEDNRRQSLSDHFDINGVLFRITNIRGNGEANSRPYGQTVSAVH